ncbi:MAG: hypothetical protein ACPHL6_13600, partial [Rubripirellula sp.]
TKEDVIQWMKMQKGKVADLESGNKSSSKDSVSKDRAAFLKRLTAMVEAGKLSKEDAEKLAATMQPESGGKGAASGKESVNWEEEYNKLLADPKAREWIRKESLTKEMVIELLKSKRQGKSGQKRMKATKGTRPGSIVFYSILIGRLKSKDIELGEMEIDVDYIIGAKPEISEKLVGKRVQVVGVSGQYLDSLLQIKRGETVKVRTGDLNLETNVIGFGFKFQVLERTAPFEPGNFGVPTKGFRGFVGEVQGKIAEAEGYEVLLDVEGIEVAEASKAMDADSIIGKRIRISGFYTQHADAYADLSQGDVIRVSVSHRNPQSDSVTITDKLMAIDN